MKILESQMNNYRKLASVALLMIPVGLSGCASTSPVATSTIRGSAQTAPADLQLLCAGEAQSRFEAASALPTASRPGPTAGTYSVDLKLPTGSATCQIDDTGAISSLEQV